MSELDTKINNFLSRSTSFSEFFGLLGEYVDGVLKERDDKTKANTELAEQNKDLFIECQRLEEKIKEMEDKAKEKPVIEPEKQEIIKPGIIQFDRDEINSEKIYTTVSLGQFFLITHKPVYNFVTQRMYERDFKEYIKMDERPFAPEGYVYKIKGQLAINVLKEVDPKLEVFYRVNQLNLSQKEKDLLVKKYLPTHEIFYVWITRFAYIKHSLVLKLGLKFQAGSPSYLRFKKYKNKTPIEVEIEEAPSASDFIDEPYIDDHKDDEEPDELAEVTAQKYTISEFANKYLLNKKSLKLYLKDLLKMRLNECFPAGFTVPASFVRDFTRTVNPDNEPFYPGRAFESDENLKSVAKYIQRTNRVFVCPYFEICYIMHSEVKRFNLKFKDQAEKKIWENNEKKK